MILLRLFLETLRIDEVKLNMDSMCIFMLLGVVFFFGTIIFQVLICTIFDTLLIKVHEEGHSKVARKLKLEHYKVIKTKKNLLSKEKKNGIEIFYMPNNIYETIINTQSKGITKYKSKSLDAESLKELAIGGPKHEFLFFSKVFGILYMIICLVVGFYAYRYFDNLLVLFAIFFGVLLWMPSFYVIRYGLISKKKREAMELNWKNLNSYDAGLLKKITISVPTDFYQYHHPYEIYEFYQIINTKKISIVGDYSDTLEQINRLLDEQEERLTK